jgi:hypothetical protein
LRGIPLACRYGKASLSRGKLRIPRRPTLVLILMISKTANIWYDQRGDRVRALGRHHPIWIFDVKTVRIIFSACICNSRRGKLVFERRWRDSKKKDAQY